MDSSPELSSPPRSISADVPSPLDTTAATTRTSRLSTDNKRGVAENALNTATEPPKKRGRKPKIKDEPPKEKKTRKPRTPKDPNAPPVSRKRKTASTAAADATEIKEELAPNAPANQTTPASQLQAHPRQQQLDQYLPAQHAAQSHQPTPEQPQYQGIHQQSVYPQPQASSRSILHPQHQSPPQYPSSARIPESIQHPSVSQYSAPAATQSPRPASSGQHFDPIRSSNVEFNRPSHTASSIPPVSPTAKVVHRASASPSINSLIDPNPTVSSVPQSVKYTPHTAIAVTSAPVSPQASNRSQFVTAAAEPPKAFHVVPSNISDPIASAAMDVDSEKDTAIKKPAVKKSDSTGATNSAAPTPPTKPARAKEQPPPLPTGSGLLSGTPFGPIASSNGTSNGDAPAGTNIWLTFPLQGQNNVTINFAREVEKKYGFAALHPKIAAQRERKRQMAAAGAALEKASGLTSNDDMSLDLSEPDSNVEMGGVDEDASGINADGKTRKRKKKVEDYDKEDDFIDDTELAWERQALMAKDGFFVYSGPLLTEGAKTTIEKADGTVRRGRGRGRGGATRGEGGTGRGGGPGSRGGRGSRGGQTVRKPRVTKADRAMMEQEKQEREKMAANLAAKSALAYPGTGVMQ